MITIDAIAKKCGVSKMTVSRALGSESHKVSPDKLKQIVDMAAKYNYRQNRLAGFLNTGKTQLVAYLASEFRHFQSNVFTGVQSALVPMGYDILTLQWSQTLKKGDRLLESIVDRRVEGVMLFHQGPHCDYSYLLDLQKHGIPAVVLDRDVNVEGVGYVGLDNFGGAIDASEHLISNNHVSIAFVSRDEDWGYTSTQERYEGYRVALQRAGIKALEPVIVPLNGYEELLKQKNEQKFTAVLCDNDVVAAFCILTFKDSGYDVPQDVSVVGFGNIPGYVDLIRPRLTTVDLSPQRIGVEASKLLLDMIAVKHGEKDAGCLKNSRVILPVSLVKRESVFCVK